MKTLAFLAAGTASLLIFGAAAAVPVQDQRVEITDTGFMPQQVEVKVGQKVIWQNVSKKDQTVTARAAAEPSQEDEKDRKPAFDSGPIKPGTSWEYTFKEPGTFSYGSTLDKTMTGVVVVRDAK